MLVLVWVLFGLVMVVKSIVVWIGLLKVCWIKFWMFCLIIFIFIIMVWLWCKFFIFLAIVWCFGRFGLNLVWGKFGVKWSKCKKLKFVVLWIIWWVMVYFWEDKLWGFIEWLMWVKFFSKIGCFRGIIGD